VGLVIIASISTYGMLLLVWSKRAIGDKGVNTFEGIGEHAYGRKGHVIVILSLCFAQLGTCCAYTVFIAQSFAHVLPMLSFYGWAFALLPVLILLTWIRVCARINTTVTIIYFHCCSNVIIVCAHTNSI